MGPATLDSTGSGGGVGRSRDIRKWTYDVVEPNTGAFRKETSWPPVPPHVALRHSRRYLVELLNPHLPDYPATAPATPAEPAAPNGAEVLGLVRHLTAN